MGMGLMDRLALSQGNGGGMGMMGRIPQSAGPIGGSVVQSLLAKHGAGVPAKAPGGGDSPSTAPTIAPPDLNTEAPVSLSTRPLDAGTAPPLAAMDTDLKKPNGLFDRIGDFLHSDEGRAALLRSGAATLQGGLGAGIEAGANFVDQRRHERAAGAQQAAELALRGKQVDNAYNLGLGGLDIQAGQLSETGRHNRAGEGNERYRVDADLYKHRTPSGDTSVRVAEDHFEHVNPSGNTVLTEQGQNYRHDTPSGDNTQDNQTQLTRDRIQAAPRTTVHAHYTTTPEDFARNGPRLRAPSQVQPAPGGATRISSDADYNALPSGTRFMGPDGQIRIKP